MRKSAITVPLLALIAGVAGFFLRSYELKTVFGDGLGLAIPYAPVTISLISLSVVVLIAGSVYAIIIRKRYTAYPDANRAFAIGSWSIPIIALILGLIIILGMILIACGIGFPTLSLFELVFVLFGILTGVSIIVSAFSIHKGTPASNSLCVLNIIPPLFFCAWLIMIYKEHSADPVTLHFAYKCLAAAASALSFFYTAGFFYKKAVTVRTIICHIMAIYLLTITLADELGTLITIVVVALILQQAINCFLFIKNLCPNTVQPAGNSLSSETN